eukprot:gnl/Chilomastix_caulleri/7032.p3 GENE.gnl/Chilomastix_caulleri/7032~~gnl/Chilomastix_caulleri/7032.p3  ORF type:complete len:64 (+),score=19.78 gnl/Chilomastix_caulleri/7032:147-338(+)
MKPNPSKKMGKELEAKHKKELESYEETPTPLETLKPTREEQEQEQEQQQGQEGDNNDTNEVKE